MTAFAIEDLQVEQLLSIRNPDNFDSAKVMDRLGMRFRGFEQWCGTIVATHMLTRDDWLRTHLLNGNGEA